MNRIGQTSCEIKKFQPYRTGEDRLSTLSVEELSRMAKEETKLLVETSTRGVIEKNIDKLKESSLIKYLTPFQLEIIKPSLLNKSLLRAIFPPNEKERSFIRMRSCSTSKLSEMVKLVIKKNQQTLGKEATISALFEAIHSEEPSRTEEPLARSKDRIELEKKRCENRLGRPIRLGGERFSLDRLDELSEMETDANHKMIAGFSGTRTVSMAVLTEPLPK